MPSFQISLGTTKSDFADPQQRLDGTAFVHGGIRFLDIIQCVLASVYDTGIDVAVQHLLEQAPHVIGTHRGRATA